MGHPAVLEMSFGLRLRRIGASFLILEILNVFLRLKTRPRLDIEPKSYFREKLLSLIFA
jgi:hypothetical protein